MDHISSPDPGSPASPVAGEIITASELAIELAAELATGRQGDQPWHLQLAALLAGLQARTRDGRRLAPAVIHQCAQISEHPALTDRIDSAGVIISLARVLQVHDHHALSQTMLLVQRHRTAPPPGDPRK